MTSLLALVAKPKGLAPGQRFRLEQWAPHLETKHGIKLTFLPYESPALTRALYAPGKLRKAFWLTYDTLRRAEVLREARNHDGVVIFREASTLGPALYERALFARGVPIIYDFDDAIWLPAAGTVNGVFSRLRFAKKTSTICSLAHAVTVGNSYLADYAKERCDQVFVVPTTIELRDYPLYPEPASDDPFVIGWTGSFSTLMHLQRARAPIEALAKRRRVVLRVVCDRPQPVPFAGVETHFVKWQAATEAQELSHVHVGLMPLPNDAFARGKCGCKALQYMGIGRPVIVSPVGVNRDIVRDGENGFLASSDEDWLAALERLAASRELRAQLGARARKTVEAGYTAEIAAARFAEAVRTAIPSAFT